ncbi:hypothetical protein GGQ54_000168 [Naumannella cuiyingiana]|uniref:TauD/TfdA-like domain-containing protein n=1 Tax=Naumannella cuiyingiana TaxID=1347891 RepID=A0A7Z0D672_9ACTN|nr:TauD/TfdA family dioxygenase [Naumannella cuiyingiana]NYI69608.1 hypothetical protein [Naumannella cuiyingiana]
MSQLTLDRYSHLDTVVRAVPSDHDLSVLGEQVEALHPELTGLDHATAFDRMYAAGESLREEVPELAELLAGIASHTSFKATVLVLPPAAENELPPTPVDYRSPEDNELLKVGIYRGLVLGLAGWYGFGYTSQQPGNVINDVIAIQRLAGVHGVSANAAAELGLHTEDASYNLADAVAEDGSRLDASYDISPDWLTLHFLRNPDRVPTFVSAPDPDALSDRANELLRQPYYINLTNPGQGGADNNADLPQALLYESPGRSETFIRANTANLIVVKDAHPEAQAALDEFRSVLGDFAVDLPTDPGCLVLIDNRRVLHGRRNYTEAKSPRFDGTDRWQQRVVCADDASRVKTYEDAARIINPQNLLARLK